MSFEQEKAQGVQGSRTRDILVNDEFFRSDSVENKSDTDPSSSKKEKTVPPELG